MGLILATLGGAALYTTSAEAKPAKATHAKKPSPAKKPAPPKHRAPSKKPAASRKAAPTPEPPVEPITLSLDVRRETLGNGLRVVLNRDVSAPTVAVTVGYGVGSRDEQRGRSGFAHLFEHMMFQGSRNVAKGDHMALISSHGGTADATTSADRTYYYNVVPSSELALALWLEADRMKSLEISSVNFENQRKVVQEEYRMRVSNAPLGPARHRLFELVYQGYFPYEHAPIGSMEDLDAARLEWARDFHARYYTPSNAVLTIAGDFEPAEAMRLVRKYFDGVSGPPASPYQDPPFPEQTSQRTAVVQDDNLRTPGILYGWPTPPYRSPDHYALELAAVILGGGESSRLGQLLVHDRGLAQQASAWLDRRRGSDIFTLQVLLAEGAKPAAVEKLIEGEIQRLSPTDAELARAKRRVKSSFVFGLGSNLARAKTLGLYEAWFGDPSLVNSELSHYLGVTKEDIVRVTRQHLSPTKRSIVEAYPMRSVEPPSPAQRRRGNAAAPAAKPAPPAAKAHAPVKGAHKAIKPSPTKKGAKR